MIFVRNEHGSHNPDEAMSLEDFAVGTRALLGLLLEFPALIRLAKESWMTLLVTGATGFVMSVLGRHWLEADPDARLVVLDCCAARCRCPALLRPVS